MRPPRPIADERRSGLAELRRVVRVLENRRLRQRLSLLLDELERDAGWDHLQEIRATHELAASRDEVEAAHVEAAAAVAELERLRAELGRVRRERDDARARLARLRELARPGLDDELVQLRAVLEADRPTSPPLIPLGQAARLVRAIRAR